MPDSPTGSARPKLAVLAAAAAGVAAVVGLLPMAGAAAQPVGICTGCPVPATTTPPALAPSTTIVAPAAGPSTAAPAAAASAPVRLVASLGPGQVVPRPRPNAAASRARFVGIVSADVLTWALATDATPAGVARLRLGAPGAVGPLVVNLGPLDAAGAGTVALTEAQELSLRTHRLYIEVVTPRNPRGEIRGEIRQRGG